MPNALLIMKTAQDRLKAFIATLGISVRQFELRAHVPIGYVKNIQFSITPEKQKNISEAFPNLNMGWLTSGEGEMLKPVTMQAGDNSTQVGSMTATSCSNPLMLGSMHDNSRIDNHQGECAAKEVAKRLEDSLKHEEFLQRLIDKQVAMLEAHSSDMRMVREAMEKQSERITALEEYIRKLYESESNNV